MKKALIITVVIVALAGLFGYATYKYQTGPKPAPATVPVSKYNAAVAQVAQANDTLKTHDAVDQHNLALQKAETDRVTGQRNQLCVAYKLPATNPLCH